jgi:tRNA (guanine-N7-)-methyltransferase
MKENILKPLRTYGRSKGKPLSPNQKLLMKKEYPKIDISKLVIEAKNPLNNIKGEVWLEIGFGGAEHILWQAKNNPGVTIIGVEPFLMALQKLLRGLLIKALEIFYCIGVTQGM